jgi:hypothetical protein
MCPGFDFAMALSGLGSRVGNRRGSADDSGPTSDHDENGTDRLYLSIAGDGQLLGAISRLIFESLVGTVLEVVFLLQDWSNPRVLVRVFAIPLSNRNSRSVGLLLFCVLTGVR